MPRLSRFSHVTKGSYRVQAPPSSEPEKGLIRTAMGDRVVVITAVTGLITLLLIIFWR